MKILVIGSGGREHALAWKLAGEPDVRQVICAPGNGGVGRVARLVAIPATDIDALMALATQEGVDLTVVGPEQPLALGIVDRFLSRGLRIFGPSAAAARLECSKVYAKGFMTRHGIPTARYRVCEDADTAHGIIDRGELGLPVVIKADGLAAGKGVVVCADAAAAHVAIRGAMQDRQFGDAGARVVIEEGLSGPEVSFFVVCDGTRAIPIGSAQDHKRVFDNDEGPNTGGMGAFAPSPLMNRALQEHVMREIVEPVIAGLRTEGHEYRGFLYVGLMITCDGPKVIEFNVRFGDPEAQVVLPSIDEDLSAVLAQAAEGALPDRAIALAPVKHVGVVLASGGYPGPTPTGMTITGLPEAERVDRALVFHAGTARRGDDIVTASGRVLTVVGRGHDYEEAIARAYEGVSKISFEGMHYRRDIGRKALNALSNATPEPVAD